MNRPLLYNLCIFSGHLIGWFQGSQVFAEVVLTAVKTTSAKTSFCQVLPTKVAKTKKSGKCSLLSSQNKLFSNKSNQKHVI